MWANHFESQWVWVTVTIDDEEKKVRFYLNGKEVTDKDGKGSKSPMDYEGRLRNYGSKHWYLGATPTQPGQPSKFFKGDIAKFMFWDRTLSEEEVSNLHDELPKEGMKVNLNFNNIDANNGVAHLFHLSGQRRY
jgi:hypothetical protein